MNPFESYIIRNYCPREEKYVQGHSCDEDYSSCDKIFSPNMVIRPSEARDSALISIDSLARNLYEARDFRALASTYTSRQDSYYQIRGLLGERMLSLVMESFLKDRAASLPSYKSFGVLRETPRHIGKGFVLRSTEDYILKHKGEINLVVLSKDKSVKTDEAIYMQEKHGFYSTEIDGMGYLHFNGDKYLLVGEVTTRGEFSLSSWDDARHNGKGVKDRVFDPLQELFPEHKIIYFVMARKDVLWADAERRVLASQPKKVSDKLSGMGIGTIFSPIPSTKQSIDDIAKEISDQIPFIKKILSASDAVA
jgi:hypothetical protein